MISFLVELSIFYLGICCDIFQNPFNLHTRNMCFDETKDGKKINYSLPRAAAQMTCALLS